jgi:eukaryotic-like serine/threonine-protein kinase
MVICRSCRTRNSDDAQSCLACGRALLALTAGEVVADRFEVLSLLGSGGMGVVYKAHDRTLEEHVALKILRPEFGRTKETARRFHSEIKLARKVSDRYVCRIHEYGEDLGVRYICMEYVDGTNLKELIHSEAGLAPNDAYEAAIQIAMGLEAIHDAGIIHRDLKTPNVMRDLRGTIRLMDFGIAKEMGSSSLTLAGQVMGTPEYMSPEQALGQPLDFRTDIYSLGVVVYEMFARQVPFRGDTPLATVYKHVEEQPVLEGCVPDPLVPVLRRALAKDPGHRFANARAIASALTLCRDQTRPSPVPERDDPEGGDARTAAIWSVPAALSALVDTGPAIAASRPSPTPPPAAAVPAERSTTAPPPAPPSADREGAVAPPGTRPSTPVSMAMPAVAQLMKGLKDADHSVRWRAVLGLAEIGTQVPSALTGILQALGDEEDGVRYAAVSALGRLGPAAKDAVPALINSLRDETIREQAADSLVKIGRAAVPALVEAVQTGPSGIRWHAAEALTRIGVNR